jgi:hypothetical protein
MTARSADRTVSSGTIAVGIAVLALVPTAVMLVLGPGLLMDDWWALRNAHFDGALAAAGGDQWLARPVAALMYALLFGVVGAHPAVYIVGLGLGNAASAVLFFHLVRVFVSPVIAATAAGLWILLPNHTTTEVWGSTVNIVLAQVCLLAGLRLLVGAHPPPVRVIAGAAALFVVATLAYEGIVPVAAAGLLVLPLVRRRKIDPRIIGGAGGALVAATLWSLTHIHPLKKTTLVPVDISPMLPANLGWGVAGFGVAGQIVLIAGVLAGAVAVIRVALPGFRGAVGEGDWTVIAGFVVIPLGMVPFAFSSYEPLGGGDRANFLSSFGGALVLAGALAMVRVVSRVLALTAGAALVMAMVVVHGQRLAVWHDAGVDADAITRALVARARDGHPVAVVGPEPAVYENTAGFEGPGNLEAALQLLTGDRDQHPVLTRSRAAFDAAPAETRFDVCSVSRLCARRDGR